MQIMSSGKLALNNLQGLMCYKTKPNQTPNDWSWYDIKKSDGETLALEIWGMWSTHSLPLLPGPLWTGSVGSDRVLSMGQIEQTVCK